MGCLLYLVSLFLPFLGIIIGAVLWGNHDPEKQKIGKNCLLISILPTVIAIILILVFVFGIFGTAVLSK